MNLKKLKYKYEAGQIAKPDYIDRMHRLHRQLFQYTEFIRDTDISKIEISDGAVVMTSRSTGASFCFDPRDKRVVPVEILNFGSYEKEDFGMILQLIGEKSVVFDIGANIGWYSVNISRLAKDAVIYAFEPVPGTFAFLERNIALNSASTVKLFNFGFSNKEETVAFYYDPACSANASAADLPQSGVAGRIECRVRKIDDFAKENRLHVDFIKCDVEGAELFVFLGGLETIMESKPVIFTEMLRKWSAAFGYHPNDIIRLLGSFGYRCFVARGGRLAGFPGMDANTVDTNFYFLHPEKHSGLLERLCQETVPDVTGRDRGRPSVTSLVSENRPLSQEDRLRAEIREKTAEIYRFREAGKEFIPGKTRVNYAGRVFDEREMSAAVDSALDFRLTLGDKGREFINRFTKYMGMKYGLAVNSGSSANLAAVAALCSPNIKNPLKPGDEVITTALAFPTTLNPIIQNGLIPVFVDIEEDTYNIDASAIEDALKQETRAIMLTHSLGNPAEMDKITDIAARHNLYIMEDTCDALDSRHNGQLCGTFGDMSTYSFYAAHHITMGEGGAILTNNHELYKEALSIRDWGRACFCPTGDEKRDGACGRRFDHHIEGLPAGYDHKYIYSNIGYNLKPLDIQCAIGIEQLEKLPRFTRLRKHNFNQLYKALTPYRDRLILPRSLPGADPSWFSFPITVRKTAGFERRELVSWLESRAIETRMLFTGNILKHPAYKNINYRLAGSLDNTDRVLESTFFVGIYPGMTAEKLEYMISTIKEFMEK